MKSSSTLKTALWLCLGSLIAFAFIFPELVVHRTISFINWDDYLIYYPSSFVLTSFFYQGGIQLWDFFGQVPHVFFWLTLGMFHFSSVLVALVYVLLSPFTQNSAQFFDRVFADVYIGSLLCIRTIGIFLLLKRLTDDKWTLRIGTVVFALLFCPPSIMFGGFYQNYIPLMMYFILSFFLTWRPVYLGMGLLFLMICFQHGIISTCYMYLGINMFAVSCALYSLFVHRKKISQWSQFFKKNERALKAGGLGLLAIGILILAPHVYMMLFWFKDIYFDAEHSRLIGFWNVAHYFHELKLDWTPPADFFRRMMDFTFAPGYSFYLGFMMFFLSGLALVMSRDRRKWIFVMAVFLVWFINFPREGFSIGLIGHWINVLTNPLKAMVRSYQTAINSIIGYLLMPLALMGLGVIKDLGQGVQFSPRRWLFLFIFLVVFVVNGCSYQYPVVKMYIIASTIIAVTALALLVFASRRLAARRMAQVLLIGLIMTDMFLSAWDMKHSLATNRFMEPHVFSDLPPQIGATGIDFRNPKIFPYMGQTELDTHPGTGFVLAMEEISLNFNAELNREMDFAPIETHLIRHVSYKGWDSDPLMRDYFAQNDHLFFFANYAVRQGPGIFENIIQRQLARSVMMVDGNEPSLTEDIPAKIVPVTMGQDQWFSVPGELKDGSLNWVSKNGMLIWDFPLPGKIPNYFASNIFTHDPWVRFFLQAADGKYIELTPAQGQLIRPMTFDVQNIKEDKVFVALPANTSPVGFKGVLLLKARDASGITSIWLHRSDDTGITFQAPTDGWLGIEFPYDPKWRIEIDGKPVRFYRVNKSFIGLPITQGEHRVLIRYWPDCWLRWGLPLAVMTAFILFIGLIFYALKEYE